MRSMTASSRGVDGASWTFSPAKRTAVPLRRYSNSCLTGSPGRLAIAGPSGRVGLIRLLAWMPLFPSTDHTMAFSGGFTYSPHTSAAFSQNAGSWLVVHHSVCQGFRSRSLQMRHTCDAEMATPSSLRRQAMAS